MSDADGREQQLKTLAASLDAERKALDAKAAQLEKVRAQVKVSDGGNAGLLLRAQVTADGVRGYQAEISSSFPAPEKPGSLCGLAPVRVHLIPPDTWFDYHITCRDEADGTHFVMRVNGVVVNDFVDTERAHTSGHIGIEHHHQGSVVEVRGFEVREL